MLWLWIPLGIVAGLAAVVVVGGAFLPRGHSCTVARTYRAAPERAWALLTGVEDFPRWRKDVKSVDVRERDAAGAALAWTEHTSFGPMPLRTVEREPPFRLVGRIDSDALPFGGTWTYRIDDLGDGQVRLSITEDGEVKNVVFRFLSRYVFGHDGTLKAYHGHVAAELGG